MDGKTQCYRYTINAVVIQLLPIHIFVVFASLTANLPAHLSILFHPTVPTSTFLWISMYNGGE
jgi:hypothetical protein